MAASKEQKQYSAEQIMKLLSEKKSDFWVAEGRKRSLALFHEAAQRVPENNLLQRILRAFGKFNEDNYKCHVMLKK